MRRGERARDSLENERYNSPDAKNFAKLWTIMTSTVKHWCKSLEMENLVSAATKKATLVKSDKKNLDIKCNVCGTEMNIMSFTLHHSVRRKFNVSVSYKKGKTDATKVSHLQQTNRHRQQEAPRQLERRNCHWMLQSASVSRSFFSKHKPRKVKRTQGNVCQCDSAAK